jgi:hypothetical protein
MSGEIGSYVQWTACVAPNCRTKAERERQPGNRPGPRRPRAWRHPPRRPATARGTNGPAPIERGVEAGRIQVGSRQCDLRTVPCQGERCKRHLASRWRRMPAQGPRSFRSRKKKKKREGARRDVEEEECSVDTGQVGKPPPSDSGTRTRGPPVCFCNFCEELALISAEGWHPAQTSRVDESTSCSFDTTRLTDLGSSCNIHARCSCCDATMLGALCT